MRFNKAGAGRLARNTRVRLVAVLVSTLAVAGGVYAAGTAHADEAPSLGQVVQIDSGGAGDGTFAADSFFTGGMTDGNHTGSNGNPNWARAVTHPIPQAEWNTFRYLESTYRVPGLIPGASYQVRLYFLDWYWTKVGQRVFDVRVNGGVVLKDFDIIKAAVDVGGDGGHLGVERDFTVTADGTGAVTIDFVRGAVDQPLVNAIVLAPPASLQIDSGGAGDGTFAADSFFTGGMTDGNHTGSNGNPNWARAVTHPIPQAEWNTFRYLESTYRVPGLTPGASYQVRLYFLDWYWTKVGKRVFDVSVNGAVVLKDFDIIKAAVDVGGDGSYLGVERDFTVTADGTGAVTIDFVRGAVDQPLVNAIVLVPPTA